jgi:anti-sigma regulatory factor (Ser/Thr protein kinase)
MAERARLLTPLGVTASVIGGKPKGVRGGTPRSVTNLPNAPSAVPQARQFASGILAAIGRGSDTIEKARLLVTELATNAVVHAQTPIRVTVEPVADRVRIEVRDDDPEPLDPPCQPDPSAEVGRGLWLVSLLACSWGVNRNERGKTVWFEVD